MLELSFIHQLSYIQNAIEGGRYEEQGQVSEWIGSFRPGNSGCRGSAAGEYSASRLDYEQIDKIRIEPDNSLTYSPFT